MRFVISFAALCWILTPAVGGENTGESTYKAQCLKCHGYKGDGHGHADMKIKPADLRSEDVQKKSDEELFNSIAFGVGHKQYAHAFAERGLDRKQISEVVSYIRTLATASKNAK